MPDNATRRILRHVMVLISGQSFAQLILILATPILTRLYGPDDFAVLALFVALLQVSTAVATGRYELALLLPEENRDAVTVAALGALLAVLFSVLLFAVLWPMREPIAAFFQLPALAPWLLLLPVAVLLAAVFALAQNFGVRIKAYTEIALANIYKALTMTGVQILFGLAQAGGGGLVVGRAIADGFANRRLIRSGLRAVAERPGVTLAGMRRQAHRYRRFPLFSLPAGLVNIMNSNLLTFGLPIILSPTVLGFYSLAMRVLGAPIGQISAPIGQVYLREAADEIRSRGSAQQSFRKALLALSLIAAAIFVPLYFFVEWLFAVIFGAHWAQAGTYARLLIPLFAVRMIVSPLSNTATITDNRMGLAINVLLLSTSSVVLYCSHSSGWDAQTTLRWLAGALSVCYLCYLPVLYWLASRALTGRVQG